MTACPGCANPSGGVYVRAALLCLGDDAAAVHVEVKAAAKMVFMGSVNA